MRPFTYERAETADEALALHAGGDVHYLGGGTNLVDLMRLGVARPERLVDVTRLPFDRIETTGDGGLVIGAAVRNSDLAADRAVREHHPALAQAVLSGASGQIRNQATVGGNLLQRTRCSYFQNVTKPCNKREPGSGCPARDGEHHNHAILGHTANCVATHPSDMAVALLALDASVRIRGRAGERVIRLNDFYRLPGDDPARDTTLEPGDLVTAVEVPPLGMPSRYRKVRERASFAFALVSIAAALDVEDGTIRGCRVALGGVAHRPWRARRAEEALRGAPATETSYLRAAHAEMENAHPLRGNRYKVQLATNLIVRTLSGLGDGS
ncbi:xanthine dehydrogenase family protein subunit M [Spirillospora sp. NPDC047279]|uniref:FAD binding domain-containing protein n=1 Tax=Spirillospora sp. NPDC047279 TaxID=3155478 RepID=UPI0033E28FD3